MPSPKDTSRLVSELAARQAGVTLLGVLAVQRGAAPELSRRYLDARTLLPSSPACPPRLLPRSHQAGAAPHPSSTSTATATASALASNSPSVFSKLGLGSRTSDTVDATPFTSSASSHLELGPGGAAAAVLSSGAGGAGAALVRSLRHAASRLGTSIERLLYDGVAESMPAWSPGQACAVLMTLALLRRRPDDEWLSEFYALTAARLSECNEAELAMLSYGLSELALTPPQPWGEALLAAAMALAEATAPAVTAAAGAAAAQPPLGTEEELEGPPTEAAAAVPLRHRPQVRPVLNGPSAAAAANPAAAAGEKGGLAVLAATLKSLVGAGGLGAAPAASRRRSPVYTASPPTPYPSAATSVDGAAGAPASLSASDPDLVLVRPINSAYDMEDVMYGTSSREGRSSAIAELLMEPAAALWGGVQRAASAATAAARRQRAGSELVTVVYNLTAAGVRVESIWLGRFLEVGGCQRVRAEVRARKRRRAAATF